LALAFSEQRQLQHLTFDHLLRDFNQRGEDIEIPFAQRHVERLHVQPVACQHRHGISPLRIHRGLSSPRIGFIDDVVVNERRIVNQFDNGSEANHRRGDVTEHFCGQQKQRRTECVCRRPSGHARRYPL
jgi:hypothetical protein